MFKSEVKIRVRYAETDKMGYCYYGNYATYFEVARVEALRGLGLSYRKMEDEGFVMPVLEFKIKYYKPAYYDDELTIETTIPNLPQTRIFFTYKTFNQEGVLLNEAETTLVFVDKNTMRPTQPPKEFINKLIPFYKEDV
ncbi:MAG TPA: thioesterase [Flavobacteriales bacterium]|nr:thioesterase [Flavobacteriales bacterium]|tara:strand:- start:54471 stop:54887 length:417 start_codon:yes stop_codon:yes gene_type:complete